MRYIESSFLTLKRCIIGGNMEKGKFIVVDGIDSCGKGTIVKKLVAYIFDKKKTHHVFITREPYISKHNAKIRRLLNETVNPKDNAELFADLWVKDRKVHVEWIEKELTAGHHVVSDRFKYSTFAYQQAQGISLQTLIEMHKGILTPDLVVIVDLPVEVAIKRGGKDKKRKIMEVFEREEHRAFQEKIRANYLKFPKIFPKERIVIIDGNSSKERVFKDACIEVEKLFD
jgi:dTMP kinase